MHLNVKRDCTRILLWALAAVLLALIDYDANIKSDASVTELGFFSAQQAKNSSTAATASGGNSDFAFGITADGITSYISILHVTTADVLWYHLATAYWCASRHLGTCVLAR